MQHWNRCLPFDEVVDLEAAALQDSSLGHRDIGKAPGAFRNGILATVEGGQESATELAAPR